LSGVTVPAGFDPGADDVGAGRFALAALVLSVTTFLVSFDGVVVTIALPAIERSFGIGQLDAQWVITAYAVPLGGVLLLGGRLGDRFGRRRIVAVGLVVFAAGLVAAGFAPATAVLLPARALQGIGAALAIPNTYALISCMTVPARRRRAFAAAGVAGSTGAASGALLGGLVVQGLGWRYVFFLSAPLALGAALLAPRVLAAEGPGQRRHRLDGTAAVLSTGGLILLVFAITNIERAGAAAASTIGAFVVAICILALFVAREARTAAPLLRLALLRIPSLRSAMAAMPGQVFAYNGTVFIGLLFFQQSSGYSAAQAGLAFVPVGIGAGLAAPLASRLLGVGRWSTVTAGGLLMGAAALASLALAPVHGSYLVHYFPGLLVLGIGISFAAVTLNATAGRDVGVEEKGVAYGLFEMTTHISSALAIAILATVAAARIKSAGGVGHAGALASGYQLAFGVSAAVAVFCAVLSVVLERRERVGRNEVYPGRPVVTPSQHHK
jgi:MFS family permease